MVTLPDSLYNDLALLHAKHRFWSRKKFTDPESPIGNFIRCFPTNNFSQTLLDNYLPKYEVTDSSYPDVPDFPYWGSKLLSNSIKIAVVADSNLGKGSLISCTLYAMLWSENTRHNLPQLRACFSYWDFSRYNRYASIFLDLWELNPETLFVTDAFKCGKRNVVEKQRSQKVLLQELKLVKPDFVITLGADSFRCVTDFNKQFRTSAKIELGAKKATVIASPFPAGMGVTSTSFPARLAQATWYIWREVHAVEVSETLDKLVEKRPLLRKLLTNRYDKFLTAIDEMKK